MVVINLTFGGLAILPVSIWVIFHNIIGLGTIWGSLHSTTLLWENLRLSLVKILLWFVPLFIIPEPFLRNPVIPLGVVILVLLFLSTKKEGLAWVVSATSPQTLPTVLYLPVSILGLIFFIATADHKSLESDRYYVGLLPSVSVFILLTLEHIILPRIKLKPRLSNGLVFLIFLLWSMYPIHELWDFINTSHRNQAIPVYNIHNTEAVRKSQTLGYVRDLLNRNSDVTLYSNIPGSVWFMTRHEARLLPWLSKGSPFDEIMIDSLKGWPDSQGVYVIWIKPDVYEVTVTPDELSQVASLSLLFSNPDGDVYFAVRQWK